MKRLFTLFLVSSLCMILTSTVLAQQSVNANAEVISDLSTAEKAELNFGNIPSNWSGEDEPTIDPSDGSNSGIVDVTDLQVGFVEVSGEGDQEVNVEVFNEIVLQESGSNDEITLTPNFNWTYDNLTEGDNPSNPERSNTTNSFTMTLDGAGNSNDGINTIMIGGLLAAPGSDRSSGTYTGSAQITIDYTTTN